MNYLDFDLLIERSGAQYKARVLNSPGGNAAINIANPGYPSAQFLPG